MMNIYGNKENTEVLQEQKKWNIKSGIAAVVIATVAIVAVLICAKAIRPDEIALSRYITISYSGINGYATATGTVDTEALYQKLAGRETNEEKLAMYRKLAESVSVTITQDHLQNGDAVQVQVSWNQALETQAGYHLQDASYSERAVGIASGNKVNVFESVEVKLSGIGPNATAAIQNNWTDDYLKTLQFSVDKTENIANEDVLTITCTTSAEDLAAHGYYAETMTTLYQVHNLSSYVTGVDQLDTSILTEIENEDVQSVISQTADTTFRMLYKATGNAEYLRQLNEESASDVKLLGAWFLNKKDTASDADTTDSTGKEIQNTLYFLYSASVTNGTSTETVYFLYAYDNSYLTSAGRYDVVHTDPDKHYTCSIDYDALYNSFMRDKQAAYTVFAISL